ncbi:MAG: hypothetical protein IJI46_01655 [Erysipelotrichaceae bacterium]|nr:hypothetical protein [Erysipelotrichaceae bacterium]
MEETGNKQDALRLWSMAVMSGHSYALYRLGFLFKSHPEISRYCFTEALKRGYQNAQYQL